MPDLNEASRKRLSRAADLAHVYRDRHAASILVTGSVARGWVDRWSDLELWVCWSELPSESALDACARRAGAQSRRVFPVEDDGVAEEEWVLDGLKIDLRHQTVASIERTIEAVVVGADVAWSRQAQLAAIQAGVALHGLEHVDAWRLLASYPDRLARAMVEAHLGFGPHAWLEMLAERGDVLCLHELYCQAERQLIGILFGLNRVYPLSPGSKWLMRIPETLSIAPADLPARLRRVLQAEPREGVVELGRLIEETIALIERHMPEVDAAPARARFRESRPSWG